jgi:hypothetical protein
MGDGGYCTSTSYLSPQVRLYQLLIDFLKELRLSRRMLINLHIIDQDSGEGLEHRLLEFH